MILTLVENGILIPSVYIHNRYIRKSITVFRNAISLACLFLFFIACEPLMCSHPLNEVKYGINTDVEIGYNPSSSEDIIQYFETNVLVNCPQNVSIDPLLLDEMSFDYSNSFGIVQQINLTCELDETWRVSGGPVGETCAEATGEVERCLIPEVPDCVDKNKYCSYPPMSPPLGKMLEKERPVDDYLTVPGTTMYYYCPTPNWAFNYGYDEDNFVSYHFTKNINEMTITCNDQGTKKLLEHLIVCLHLSAICLHYRFLGC